MFDIGWTEMALVAVVAILIIGPKELPVVLRSLGRMMGKARSLTREFRLSLDEMAREADFSDAMPGPEDFHIHNEKILADEARKNKPPENKAKADNTDKEPRP